LLNYCGTPGFFRKLHRTGYELSIFELERDPDELRGAKKRKPVPVAKRNLNCISKTLNPE